MDTKNTLYFDPVRFTRFTEVGIYAGLATVLLGQLFYHQHLITLLDASLAMLGTVFGLMASCGAAPLTGLFTRRGADRQATGEVLQHPLADVLPFDRRESQSEPSQSDGASRRAA